MSKLGSYLTYANVMATIAVFLALGGGAYAVTKKAPPNSVNSRAIVDGQVKSQDVALDSIDNDQIDYHGIGTGSLSDGLISAPKLAPIRQFTNSKTITQGGFGEVYASCPSGQIAISGGANYNPSNTGVILQADFKFDKDTWYARGTNPSSQYSSELTAFVDCLGPVD